MEHTHKTYTNDRRIKACHNQVAQLELVRVDSGQGDVRANGLKSEVMNIPKNILLHKYLRGR
jgi:hypothetical protein